MRNDSSPEPLLSFKLEFDDSVELDYLAGSCLAFSREFSRYSKRYHAEFRERRQSLRVIAVRSGSMELDLAPYVAFFSDPQNLRTCISYIEYIKKLIEYLKGLRDKKEKPDFTKKTLNNVNSIINPVANGNANQWNITSKNPQFHFHIHVTKPEAQKIAHAIVQEKKLLDTGEFKEYKKVELVWYQARNDKSGAGDRAIISSITGKKVKVTFQNETDKQRIMSNARNPFSGTFIVDVAVHFKEGKASGYHVTKIHD
jgi:hypothetical protein